MIHTTSSHDVEFARFAGEMAESLSYNRSIGQIYGLLYISPRPLSLSEIAKKLAMSKGNASLNLRILAEWGAVRTVPVSGTRQDFYEADRDLKGLALRRLEQGLGKRLDRVEQRLKELGSGLGGLKESEPHAAYERIRHLEALLATLRRAVRWLPKAAKMI